MHIAGKVPDGAHQETFVAMSAILLGAAETAASELREECKDVTVYLNSSKLYITSAGPKALLVLKTELQTDIMPSSEEIKKSARTLGEML